MSADASSAARSSRRNIACDECKRRKVRCSTEPQCSNCTRDGKRCSYSAPVHRVPALERKIRRYEALLETIRRAWDIYVPHKPLQDALATLDTVETGNGSLTPTPGAPARISHGPEPPASLELQDDPEHDPEPLNPEDFEFDESSEYRDVIDGIGFLNIDPYQSGYTGPQSGTAALEFLRSLPTAYSLDDNHKASVETTYSGADFDEHASAETLIGDYFQLFHPAYPLLHEGTFRARVSGALSKPKDGSWPMLYNMVLAAGAFARDTEGSDHDLAYFRLAREAMTFSVIEKGSLTYVQGLALMANYLQKRSKPNAGFALVGIAWSMAMAIGLHREFGPSGITPFAMELRRRTWWCLYLFVSGAQLITGRPPASLVGTNVRLPTNLNDFSLAVDMEVLAPPRAEPTVASCIIAQVPLSKIASEVQSVLLTSHVPPIDVADRLDRRIEKWESQLPYYLRLDRETQQIFEWPKRALFWRSYHLRIILNRPFLFQLISQRAEISNADERVQRCISAADLCVDLVHKTVMASANLQRGHAWYATYRLISASFVHAICIAYAPNADASGAWAFKIRQAIEALERTAFAHSMARRAQRILQNIHDRFAISSPSQQIDGGELDQFMANNFGVAQQHQDIALQNNSMEWFSLQQHLNVPQAYTDDASVLWPWLQAPNEDLLDAAGGTLLQDYQDEFDVLGYR